MAKPMFTFEVAGDKQIARGFSRFADDIKDLSPAFREIAKSFRDIMRKQFDSEGSYGGSSWAPLNPTYAEWKAANFGGKPILQLTGAMMESLVDKTGSTIEEISKLSMVLGSKLPYPKFHQTSTRYMPARPVIKLTEENKRTWMRILQRYLVKEAKKEFGGLMPTAGAGRTHIRSIQ